jgi:hypothetical protein
MMGQRSAQAAGFDRKFISWSCSKRHAIFHHP